MGAYPGKNSLFNIGLINLFSQICVIAKFLIFFVRNFPPVQFPVSESIDVTMAFEVEGFLKSPSLEVLNSLKKSDLKLLSDHFEIITKSSMRKHEIKKLVLEHMVDENMLDESCLEEFQADKSDTSDSSEVLLKQLELDFREKERQWEQKLKDLEIQKEAALREIEANSRVTIPDGSQQVFNRGDFDLTKQLRLVPSFQEEDVESFFLHFEKLAHQMVWPPNQWTLLLQSSLTGKAQQVYSSLSVDDCCNYQVVKKAILKAYELVPEAYRQKFRNCKRKDNETYVEFARNKSILFDRWCSSLEVNDFEQLKQLVLVEEFKRCVPFEIRVYLDEQKVVKLKDAATKADDFSLTHHNFSKGHPKRGNVQGSKSSSSPSLPKSEGHSPSNRPKGDSVGKTTGPIDAPTCAYCRAKGHLIGDCEKLKKKRQRDFQGSSNALAVSRGRVTPPSSKIIVSETKPKPPLGSEIHEKYRPFVSDGLISLTATQSPVEIKMLRDTGANQTLVLDSVLPFSESTYTGSDVLVEGVPSGNGIYVNVPLHEVHLQSDLVSGPITVGILPTLPIKGVSCLLGNDLAGDKVSVNPVVVEQPLSLNHCTELEENFPRVFPACAVTRAMTRKLELQKSDLAKESLDSHSRPKRSKKRSRAPEEASDIDLGETFIAYLDEATNESTDSKESSYLTATLNSAKIDAGDLRSEQEKDPEIKALIDTAVSEQDLHDTPVGFYLKNDILMRKYRPQNVTSDDECHSFHQIVVPPVYRAEILSVAHDTPFGGHLGVNKTYARVLNHFYWPRMKSDVSAFCKTCHTCQMVGKPNQNIPPAPLKPIPAFQEPFSRVIIDCVGPLPRTRSGNQYLLTIMCASTRFPEAIPLRNIKAKTISNALLKFFTTFGLPKCVQSDQGSNFMSNLFQQVLYELDIRQVSSSAYHPESQGALERFHQTLKTMMKTYCFENEKEWDEGVHFLLFAARESVQDSLGFSPFQLVFGHEVRGPLKMLKEKWLDDVTEVNLLDYVSSFKARLTNAYEVARANLTKAQQKMKTLFDKTSEKREFSPGDQVLVLLPITGQPLRAKYFGPYTVHEKVSDTNYVVLTPGRRKEKRLCHVNMIKKYFSRSHEEESPKQTSVPSNEVGYPSNVEVAISQPLGPDEVEERKEEVLSAETDLPGMGAKLNNSDVMLDLDAKLSHLPPDQKADMKGLLNQYPELFTDVPRRTHLVSHNVDVGDATPIKQHPYRLSPDKRQYMEKEIKYMLENDIIEVSDSPWSSPCILIPKPNGEYRFCTDYRKVNAVTKTDSYPIPRIDDCIDQIGKSKFVTKFDLLKGYWEIPLSESAKQISAFVTPTGLYQYKVTPFGMKNSGSTFQRFINGVVKDLEGCGVYIDDIIVYSQNWSDHVNQIKALFERLNDANLTVNLVKSEIAQAHVVFLGHVVGQGQVKPVRAKVEAIANFPVPVAKKPLMRFLGMAGYYRRYCPNFSDVVAPLTNLLSKKTKFLWDGRCQEAFDKVKSLLMSSPVLVAPDYDKPFKLAVDASDAGIGSVLMQEDDEGVDHPVCYFSKKFNKHQTNYSTVEKETLALLLSLQMFDVYLGTSAFPIKVMTDHNPLTFVHKMKNHNKRLLRWSLLFQDYNLDIHHIKGKDNIFADALSRV